MPYNNHDDLLHLSFVLKILLFSEIYLEPSWTSLMKLFCKNSITVRNNRKLIYKKNLFSVCKRTKRYKHSNLNLLELTYEDSLHLGSKVWDNKNFRHLWNKIITTKHVHEQPTQSIAIYFSKIFLSLAVKNVSVFTQWQ